MSRLKDILPTIIAFLFWAGIGVVLYKCGDGNINSFDSRVDDLPIENQCEYSDGSHSASVGYYNPDTGHRANYDLEVEVEDCEVTAIYFPQGGRLDNSHISPTKIDDNGDASIEDDKGRRFNVHIEN